MERDLLSVDDDARIRGVDKSAALEIPGVVAVLTADDLPLARDGNGTPAKTPMASGEVLFAGHIVAVVLAESDAAAQDGVAAVVVDYEPLPVIGTLHDLDDQALVRILREPKNAIIKQYQKYFDLEKVRLKFTDDAVAAIAREALKRGTGARGLRAILEEVMLEIMYELPSIQDLKECIITREVILNRERPVLVSEPKEQSA